MLSSMDRMSIHDRGYDEIPQHPLERLEPMRRNIGLRQSSFDSWPQSASIKAVDLINDGFYYMGMSDKVQCVYCGGVLSGWRENDNVHQEHGRHFRRCPSLNEKNESDECNDDIETDGGDALDHSNKPVKNTKLNGNLHSGKYSVYKERLQSFKDWPSDHPLQPKDLASAGLYFKGLNLLLYINRKEELKIPKGNQKL
jgi:E3 ubiquitin-protein ligase XIAP